MVEKTLPLAIAVLALGLGGCAGIRDQSGYVVNQEFFDAVQPGIDNKESVQATLGRPTFVGQFDDSEWIYVTRLTTQFAFRQPRLKGTSIYTVKFDDAGNVVAVSQGGPELAASINPENDKTPTLGRSKSFFEELFGNIGQVGQGFGPPAQ